MPVINYIAPACREIRMETEGAVMVLSRPMPYSLHDMDDNTIFSEDF